MSQTHLPQLADVLYGWPLCANQCFFVQIFWRADQLVSRLFLYKYPRLQASAHLSIIHTRKSTTKSFDDNVRLSCLVTANICHMGWGFLSYLDFRDTPLPSQEWTHQHWQRHSIVLSHGCIASKNNSGLHIIGIELAISSCPGKKIKLHSSLEQMALYRQQSHERKRWVFLQKWRENIEIFVLFWSTPCTLTTRQTSVR